MKTTLIRTQLEKAKRIRDRRHWLMLACILIGLIPTAAAVVLKILPAIPDIYIFPIGFSISIAIAKLIYTLQMRNVEKPKCPACGCDWEIFEFGARQNNSISSDGGVCPKCGIEI